MSKKIGILTRYYKSENYGGVLQAYALNRYVNSLGLPCETIQYDGTNILKNNDRTKHILKDRKVTVSKAIRFLIRNGKKSLQKSFQRRLDHKLDIRKQKFLKFRYDSIPHSSQIYTCDTIHNSNQTYNVFIVGSDRVWMPNGFLMETERPFFLDFVSPNKKKIAYAASMGRNTLEVSEIQYYQEFLSNFDAIGLREKAAKKLLDPIIYRENLQTEWVVDPVFLIEPQEWDMIAQSSLNNSAYIFVYLLDNIWYYRRLISKFAKLRKLRIVTVPFSRGVFNLSDLGFGETKMIDCGPEDFVSCIRDADFIFTDSFHCAAFSLIFKKEFFVFDRDQATHKNSYLNRILSLFDMVGIDNHHIINKETTVEQLLKIGQIVYNPVKVKLDQYIRNSKLYLKDNLFEENLQKCKGGL